MRHSPACAAGQMAGRPFAANANGVVLTVEDAINRLGQASSSALGLWDLQNVRMNPSFFSLLLEKLPDNAPKGSWNGAITLNLIENYLGEFHDWKVSLNGYCSI